MHRCLPLHSLTHKLEEGRDGFVSLKVDPPLDPLRDDPRFQDLPRRMY